MLRIHRAVFGITAAVGEGAVVFAPAADDVEGLQRKAGRIDVTVARRAGFGVAMFVELLPDRRRAADVGLHRRYARRRRGGRRHRLVFADDGPVIERLFGERERAAFRRSTAAILGLGTVLSGPDGWTFHLWIGPAFAFPSSGPHQPIEGQTRIVGTDGDPGLPGLCLRGKAAGAAPRSAKPTPLADALD